MQSRFLSFILPGLFAFLPAIQAHRDTSIPGIDPHKPLHPEFVHSHNQFAFHLLSTVLAEDSSAGNKLVSPLSLYLTLGMLCNGAAHETRDSIADALQTADIELPNFNGFCKEAMQQLPLEDDHVQFNLANAIWYNRKKLTLRQDYETLMENFYYAPLQPLDFGAHNAAVHINEWIAGNTDNEINNLIAHTSPSDAMILVNALYFKSAWEHPFDANDSYKGDFLTGEQFTHPVPYMRKIQNINTYSDTAFTMVELPCGQGKDFALYVFLPQDQDKPVAGWLSKFTPVQLHEAIDKMTLQYVDLSLPRWECSYSLADAGSILEKMGAGTGFTTPGLADFSNMYAAGMRKAAISQIFHDTRIRVDEDGLVAASATGAEMTLGINRSKPNPRVIRYDHPYAYLLMERKHDLILMAGVVNDPQPRQPKRMQSPPAQPKARHRLRSIFHPEEQ